MGKRWNSDSIGHGSSIKQRFKPRTVSAILLVLVAAVAVISYVHRQPNMSDTAKADQSLVEEVARLTVVPVNEKPSITTVVDKSQINQPFLQNAENGDKVLLYFQAQRAIVYRPSSHKIVNMGPLTQPTPQVFLRNGSKDAIPDSVSEKIISSNQFLVASRDVAVKRTYTETLVIDLSGNRPDVAERLAGLLGATVSTLPDGESRPDADLLVIVGADAR